MITIQDFDNFFHYNLKCKEMIAKTVPQFTDGYDENRIMHYSDSLFEAINDIRYYVYKMMDTFSFLSSDKEKVGKIFKTMEQELSDCGFQFEKLKKFYEKRFYQMRESFIDEVGNTCIGEYCFFYPPIEKATSMNELIHVLHQAVVNNNSLYRNIHTISTKDGVYLRGNQNEIALQIYNTITPDINLGDWTEILSVSEDKILMMVRDRGHALSIEITKEEDYYFINYFIPKICNVEMINMLPGVSKVNETSSFTSGSFRTSKEELPEQLIQFILKVPTDDDMIKQHR